MKKHLIERNIAAVLFILVLITFSLADRDSKKVEHLYLRAAKVSNPSSLVYKSIKTDTVTTTIAAPAN